MKTKISLLLNILFILIILLLLWGYYSKIYSIRKLKEQKNLLTKTYEKQLDQYARVAKKTKSISDTQFEQELRNRDLFVFSDYKGRKFKHLNHTYNYVINTKTMIVHKASFPGGSSAYLTSLDNREYSSDLKDYPKSKYKYCSFCFPR